MFSFKKIFFIFAGKSFSELRVDLESRRDIAPEDILLDKATNFQKSFAESPFLQGDQESQKKLEVLVRERILTATFALFFVILVGFAVYMLYLYVGQGNNFSKIAAQNALQTFKIGPSRGDILSSEGIVIAGSTSIFDLIIRPANLSAQTIDSVSAQLGLLFDAVSQAALGDKIYDAQKRNIGELIILKSITEGKAAHLDDVLEKYSALELRQRSIRSYPYGSTYAHIVGYTAGISAEELKNFAGYTYDDQIGKKGIELYFEKLLRGIDGLFAKFISSQGNVESERLVREVKRGEDVRLTINHGLQEYAHESLQRALAQYQINSGAIVALDPASGNILAMVSLPDFNPNDFTRGLSDKEFKKYFENPVKPLFNRVTSGEYATGSVIKPFIAAAALEENIIDSNKYIFTHGFIDVPSVYDPAVTYRFYDWKDHGAVNMKDAIAVSSNVYFYTIGGGFAGQEGLGIERIADYLKRFNWGRTFGLDFAVESAGLVPTPQWKEAVKNERWAIGDTYNVSIGQGDLLATPLQVASATAVFANGGKLLRPNISAQSNESRIISENLVSERTLDIVRSGMRDAVLSGSSRFLSQLQVSVAGKTGTAQAPSGDNHAWFSGFAPYEDPAIVITVLLEHGHESTNAVRVAHEILKWYFEQIQN